MTGTANKRQKRQEYRNAQRQRQQEQQQQQQGRVDLGGSNTSSHTLNQGRASNGDGDDDVQSGEGQGTSTPAEREMRRKGGKGGTTTTTTGFELPKKKFYRQRAHANPFSDHALVYPISPAHMDWSTHYPAFVCADPNPESGELIPRMRRRVEIADVGCGFGGLLVALSPVFPETLMIGMELRTQVLDYVQSRIQALRLQNHHQNQPHRNPNYQNISALRTNTMKHLPNFFHRHQLTHLFLCFPDPHFKARKHKARIVSAQLNAEYAYVVRPGGKVYTITDVEELAGWMEGHFEGGRRRERVAGGEGGEGEGGSVVGEGEQCMKWRGVEELWERVGEDELATDPCVRIMMDETEEGKKVSRNGGKKFVAVWRRKLEDPEWPDEM